MRERRKLPVNKLFGRLKASTLIGALITWSEPLAASSSCGILHCFVPGSMSPGTGCRPPAWEIPHWVFWGIFIPVLHLDKAADRVPKQPEVRWMADFCLRRERITVPDERCAKQSFSRPCARSPKPFRPPLVEAPASASPHSPGWSEARSDRGQSKRRAPETLAR